MSNAADPSPWPLLAPLWEELFPLRPARVQLALRLSATGGATLDAGCATGSLVRALAAQGRAAWGLDLEPAFLDHARLRAEAEGLAPSWRLASLLDLRSAAAGQRFQLVTCLGQTLPHLLEEAEWLDFFGQAKAVLVPGGHLVIQVVNDAGQAVGQSRALPPLRPAGGLLERVRTVLGDDRARFQTRFQPSQGPAFESQVLHRCMGPERAAELLREAGLEPGEALADEAGAPFTAAAPGWLLIARNPAI